MEKPKHPLIPDDRDSPLYQAANKDRLILRHRPADGCWQYPPEPACGGPPGSASRVAADRRQRTSYSYPLVSGTPIVSS